MHAHGSVLSAKKCHCIPAAPFVSAEGKTGVPFVDANMRELAATGFMSNRGRQNVASFLTKDLGLDWRMGAEWFEHLLVRLKPRGSQEVCSDTFGPSLVEFWPEICHTQ